MVGYQITDEEVPLSHQLTGPQTKDEEERDRNKKRTTHEVMSDDGKGSRPKKEDTLYENSMEFTFHFLLLRTMKPLTAFMVAVIIMVDTSEAIIATVSCFLGLLLILILVDAYLQWAFKDEKDGKTPRINTNRVSPNKRMN